jgi:hypothetical protein
VAILVRPVREQLEHDRLIRHLLTKYKKKQEVAANIGDEHVAPVKIGGQIFFPDLVLSADRRLTGVVEVETGESVHKLEALYQWVPFSKARVPFHLYVPVVSYDAARRFCEEHGAQVAEIWTYRPAMEGFDLVRMHHDPVAAALGPGATLRPLPPPPPKAVEEPPAVAPATGRGAGKASRSAAEKPARAGSEKPVKAPPAKPVPAKPASGNVKPAPAKPAPAKPAPAKAAPARAAKPEKPQIPAPPVKPAKTAPPPKAAKAARPAKGSKPAGKKNAGTARTSSKKKAAAKGRKR